MERQPLAFEVQSQMVDLLTPELIAQHLAMLSQLDGERLLESLDAHQALPKHDPARYVLDTHERSGDPDMPVRSFYGLGVVFGRSLIAQGARSRTDYLPPVVSVDFAPEKEKLIERYLALSAKRSLSSYLLTDSRFRVVLRSVRDFADHCRTEFPELGRLDAAELIKGAHDYLSVVRLLEAQNEAEAKRVFRARLGLSLKRVGQISLRGGDETDPPQAA